MRVRLHDSLCHYSGGPRGSQKLLFQNISVVKTENHLSQPPLSIDRPSVAPPTFKQKAFHHLSSWELLNSPLCRILMLGISGLTA